MHRLDVSRTLLFCDMSGACQCGLREQSSQGIPSLSRLKKNETVTVFLLL